MANRGEVKDPEHDKRVKHPEKYQDKQGGKSGQNQDRDKQSRSGK